MARSGGGIPGLPGVTVRAKYEDRLTTEALEVIGKISPSSDEDVRRRQAVLFLEKIVTTRWATAKVDVYGSAASSFSLTGADCDATMIVAHSAQREQYMTEAEATEFSDNEDYDFEYTKMERTRPKDGRFESKNWNKREEQFQKEREKKKKARQQKYDDELLKQKEGGGGTDAAAAAAAAAAEDAEDAEDAAEEDAPEKTPEEIAKERAAALRDQLHFIKDRLERTDLDPSEQAVLEETAAKLQEDLNLLTPKPKNLWEQNVIVRLARDLVDAGAIGVKPLPRARVPVVKFYDPTSKMSCDVCLDNILACENTALLRMYANIDPRLRQLVLIVKHWAKRREINTAYKGTLSSYAYVILAIYHCQREHIVPNLQKIRGPSTSKRAMRT